MLKKINITHFLHSFNLVSQAQCPSHSRHSVNIWKEWMNGLETKLLVLKFSGVYAILLIYTIPLSVFRPVFLCFGMLASAGPPFLSRCLAITCSTIERNLQYHKSVVGPGQEEDITSFQKCALNCCPVILQECPCSPRSHPGFWLCISWVRNYQTQQPGADRKGLSSALQATNLGWSPRYSHKLEGLPRLLKHFLENNGIACLKTCDCIRALLFGPTSNSRFRPSFFT